MKGRRPAEQDAREKRNCMGERQICRVTVRGESGTAAIITDSNLARRLQAPVGVQLLPSHEEPLTTHRIQPVRVAVLGGIALVMLFQAPSWAQSKRGSDAAPAPVASAEAMSPRSLEALLDDTDAIVRGVVSRPAPVRTHAGAVRHRDYDVHSPVVVFQRADSTLGLNPGPSWTQTVRVRLVTRAVSRHAGAGAFAYPVRGLTPRAESVLFLKKHADVLTVTAAFRITNERLVPQLTEATFVHEYTGMRIDDFAVAVLKDLFLGPSD